MIEGLVAEGFVRMPGVEEPAGIYCLLQKGRIVYVGKSKAVLHRIGQHRSKRNGKLTRSDNLNFPEGSAVRISFDDVWVLFCAERDLERLELEYIDRFKPPWNIQIRQPLPKFKIDIHVLAAQMNWELRKDIPRRMGL